MNWKAPHDAHHRELLVKPPDLHVHFPKITNCRRGQHLQAWYVEARSFAHNVAKPEAGRSCSRCCHELATDVTDTHGALNFSKACRGIDQNTENVQLDIKSI